VPWTGRAGIRPYAHFLGQRAPAPEPAITVPVLEVRWRAGIQGRRGSAALVGLGHTGNTVRLIKADQYFGAQRQFDIAHGKWSKRR
jgi:hypothetical protein